MSDRDPDDHDIVVDPDDYDVVLRPRSWRPAGELEPSSPAPTPAHRGFAPVHPPEPLARPAPRGVFPDPIPVILPHGSISTLNGASGVGKTALLATWVYNLQHGLPINGHPTNRPAAIGILACDRPWRDHAQWFAKANCQPFPYYALWDDPTYDWNGLRDYRAVPKLFGQAVDKLGLPPGSLLIVDPMPLFIPGRLIDYKDVGIGMALLGREIHLRQFTMIGVCHVAKQKGNPKDQYVRPQDRILGSGAQVGYSETAMYLISPEESQKPYYEVGWVPHQAKAEAFRLTKDDQGLFTSHDDLDLLQRIESAAAVFPDDDKGIKYEIALHLIAQATQTTPTSAQRYFTQLKAQNRIEKVPGRSRGYWRMATGEGQTPPPPTTTH